jgi:hypothetical protein
MSTDESEPVGDSEEERVLSWRAGELVRAGYDECTAIELAFVPHIDLHRATELLRRGCPLATAVKILL